MFKFILIIIILLTNLSYSEELTHKFVDKEYKYSLYYPESWKANIYRSGIVLANINSKDNKSGLQIRKVKKVKDINEFVHNYIQKFERDLQAILIKKNKIKFKKFNIYTLSFSSKKKYFLKTYIIPIENSIYIFQSGTPENIKEEIEPVLDSIAYSFIIN